MWGICYIIGMAIISEISKQKKKGRVNIFLDGTFYCGLDLFTLTKYGLKEGLDIDEEKLDELQLESEGGVAFDKCMKYISIRMRTEKEIKDYLTKKGYLSSTIDATINKLAEYGYINDELFAKTYVSFVKNRLGINRIRQELAKYGVNNNIIEDALYELDQTLDAFNIAKKYLRTHDNDTMKLKKYLYSKGFSYDAITCVVRKLSQGEEADE